MNFILIKVLLTPEILQHPQGWPCDTSKSSQFIKNKKELAERQKNKKKDAKL
jgi:hypothetical protein